MRFKHLIVGCVLFIGVRCLASDNAPLGFLEGHLRILAAKEVELAEGNTPKFSTGDHAEYPLIILSQDGKREVARVTADENGKYRIALRPGDYILDLQGRRPKGHVRAKPQPFTVISNQTVHMDMNIDTGIR